MITKNESKEKIGLFEKLNISEQRGLFLKNKCDELYKQNGISNSKDVIDLIHEMREITTNAQEDILVCYIIGFRHGHVSCEYKNQTLDFLKNLFE